MTITEAPVAPEPRPAGAPVGAGRRELQLFLAAAGVMALHVVDDSFLQPQAGTSAGDHLVSGLVPLGLLALAAVAYARLRGGLRAALALVVGVFGIAFGIEAVYYTTKVGPSGDDFTGILSMVAGIALLGLGFVTLWRTRRRDGGLLRRALGVRAPAASSTACPGALRARVVGGFGHAAAGAKACSWVI